MNRVALRHFLGGWAIAAAMGLSAESPNFNPPDTNYPTEPLVIERGREAYRQHCRTCHELRDSSTGPTLGGVTFVRDRDWLLEFIRSPQKAFDRQDPIATELLERYRIPMPGYAHLGDQTLGEILAYIDRYSRRRKLNYLPEGRTQHLQAMMEIPVEPIKMSGSALKFEEVATLPKTATRHSQVRLGNLRQQPGDPTEALFINDHDGFIYRLEESEVSEVFRIDDHAENFVPFPGLATGLGSFAFHPDFARNRLVYVSHTEAYTGIPGDYRYADHKPRPIQWIVSEFEISDAAKIWEIKNRREIIRIDVPNTVHGLQEITFNPWADRDHPDYGLLFLGMGDGGSTEERLPELSHSKASPLGTIMRIDPRGDNGRNGNYGIPEDNPFVDSPTPGDWAEIYAWGFRNPHRLSWAPNNPDMMLATDIGYRAFEEINVIQAGRDYGWNVREGPLQIDPVELMEKAVIPWTASDPGYAKPLAVYSHREGFAVIGGHVYRGPIESLQNHYVFGDIITGRVFTMNPFDDSKRPVPLEELELIDPAGNRGTLRQWMPSGRIDLRFGEDWNGDLYIMTKIDGKIRRVTEFIP